MSTGYPIKARRVGTLAGALFVLTVFTAMAPPGRGIRIEGVARVIDGDTIDLSGQRVRLEGIDAPESAQTCATAGGDTWACGRLSASALRDLVGRETVSCELKGQDKYGRPLGICFSGSVELNDAMVRDGLAWAFVKYSNSYVASEAAARAEHRGIWQGLAQPAWEFRQKAWQIAQSGAPEGCAIKGNITSQGHIYHLPWSTWYDKVKIDPETGERWFCSEAEATAAGWRPVAEHARFPSVAGELQLRSR